MPSPDIAQIDLFLREALIAFTENFARVQWWGKEHDCVNRFVHGFLFPRCAQGLVLAHPTQVGIDVAVAQPPGLFVRGSARKDVVIWPAAWMSCWNSEWQPVNHPVAVMEWKVIRGGGSLKCHAHDREWLHGFAQWQPRSVGYAVTLNHRRGAGEKILVTRFHRDRVDETWLHL
jgi:hypothetical protein